MKRLFSVIQAVGLVLVMLASSFSPAIAREGDTLVGISIEPPTLVTWPENLLHEDDTQLIDRRANEARNSGVPLAVRIVDMTMPERELPFQVRSYAHHDFSEPLTAEQREGLGSSWMASEPIETRPGANDGFLLLVLVPEDRTQTQVIWWYGPNALPLNGLTATNIEATYGVMDSHIAQGSMPNAVFYGLSEFGYNIQFGSPERLIRTDLQEGLHLATIPLAIVTAIAGAAVPTLVLWLSRRVAGVAKGDQSLTPWEAAALHKGRAQAEIPAAMLIEETLRGTIESLPGGEIRIAPSATSPAAIQLRRFADDDGVVDRATMYEIQAITEPVNEEIENHLAEIGAMTPDARSDRTWVLVAIAVAGFLMLVTTVPSVASMSRIGVFAIGFAAICIAIGWWWLAYRSYTTPAGQQLLRTWREQASVDDRFAFDLVVEQDLLLDQAGGPDVDDHTQLSRRLRGLGST